MFFQCNKDKTCGKKTWKGEIILLVRTPFHYEAVITARDTSFHVIVGKYRNGNYLCVPNMNFGCELSRFSDTFWNAEKIRKHLDNPIDVESLVSGIKALSCFDESI